MLLHFSHASFIGINTCIKYVKKVKIARNVANKLAVALTVAVTVSIAITVAIAITVDREVCIVIAAILFHSILNR